MNLTLYTVTVTALVGSISDLDAGLLLDSLAASARLSGILDAAVTVGSENVSFTGQVEAPGVIEAIRQATTAMVIAGYHPSSAVIEKYEEEDINVSELRVAVA